MNRYLTAITRKSLSRPAKLAVDGGLIQDGDSVLDYGCGKGSDVRLLGAMGVDAIGYDPHFCPDVDLIGGYDVVMCNYVLNVIEDTTERVGVLKTLWSLSSGVVLVAVRTDKEKIKTGQPWGDGLVTRKGTFQKLFSRAEVDDIVLSMLHTKPNWIAEGIFYLVK